MAFFMRFVFILNDSFRQLLLTRSRAGDYRADNEDRYQKKHRKTAPTHGFYSAATTKNRCAGIAAAAFCLSNIAEISSLD